MGFECNNCGECCGPTFATKDEYLKIKRHLRVKKIKIEKKDDILCKFRVDGKCAIYPVRPIVCKRFGEYENLLCPSFKGAVKLAIFPTVAPYIMLNEI